MTQTIHTFETDSDPDDFLDDIFGDAETDEAPSTKKGSKEVIVKRPAKDAFINFEGLEVADDRTAARWASVIMDRHPGLIVRRIVSVNHPVNLYGGWAIEEMRSGKGSGDVEYKRLRYADNTQLREIYEALGSPEFERLISGDGLPGPYRYGRPPTDAHGKPYNESTPDPGYGSLAAECEWIEANDNVVIRYAGEDPVMWPNGCWIVESVDNDDQLLNAAQIKHVAHKVFGMPEGEAPLGIPSMWASMVDPLDSAFDGEDVGVDPLDEVFGSHTPRPKRKPSTLAEWSDIIMGQRESDPFDGIEFDLETEVDPLEEVFG
jgi:hypothetical protein